MIIKVFFFRRVMSPVWLTLLLVGTASFTQAIEAESDPLQELDSRVSPRCVLQTIAISVRALNTGGYRQADNQRDRLKDSF